MFGALLDVSASMKSAYPLQRSSNANVERTHAILTAIRNIVIRAKVECPEVIPHKAQECIFVGAFGLSGPNKTCDLISLLENADPKDVQGKDGYQALTDLAKEYGAPQTEPWIRKHLSHFEAQSLYQRLRSDESLLSKLIELIPPQETIDIVKSLASWFLGVDKLNRASEATVLQWSDAYKFAHGIVESDLQQLEQPKPRPIQKVSEMLDDLLPSKVEDKPSPTLHDRIEELILPIRPYIFGDTPMCKSLNDAEAVFNKTKATLKVLFILSNGSSTDGDPRPIAQKLHELGVIIATCFLTSDHVANPRCLFDEADPDWVDGKLVLFEMSSTRQNSDAPISHLIASDAKWKLPDSGKSRLFIQANTLDVINEFCEKVISQMTEPK